MQDRRIDERRDFGLAPRDLFRLAADARPDRIDRVEYRPCLLLGHVACILLNTWAGLLAQVPATHRDPGTSAISASDCKAVNPIRSMAEIVEEFHNRVGELIIAVAGHHVAGARHVGIGGMRHPARETPARAPRGPVPTSRRAPAAPAFSDLWRRRSAVCSRRSRASESTLSAAVEKSRVPVPAPAAVGVQPQVLLQPLVRTRPRTMRQIGGDRVGGLFDRGKSFLAHARA